ncbi:MAG: FecR domain-containing protein [Lysobacterales bacterium]
MSDNRIDQQAADWVARIDSGAATPEEQQALDRWLAADRRHLGAYARASAVFLHADRASALGPGFELPAAEIASAQPRRTWLLGAAAAAVLMVALVFGLRGPSPVAGIVGDDVVVRLQSGLGEVRRLPLADGSVLTLNTDTSVSVVLTPERREIQLHAGEALFDVAKDSARPFIVRVQDTQVRAVGTSFTVRRLQDDALLVMVREGQVQVESASAEPVPLQANMRARAQPGSAVQVEQIATESVTHELTWREGMISFDGDTLAEAAAEFARYSQRRLLVDPAVANKRIVGLYAANDPEGFAAAAALSLGLQTRSGSEGVHLLAR